MQHTSHKLSQPVRVMYVNDDQAITMLSERALTAFGYEVEPHECAEPALAAFRAAHESYAALITDMSMPGMSGLELLRGVLSIRADLPCILTSSMLRPSDVEEARRLGAHPYTSDLFSFDELAQLLARLLRAPTVEPSPGELEREVRDMLPKYITATRREIAALLARCTSAADLRPAQLLGHRLKGSGGSYGLPSLTVLGGQLELAARETRLEAARALLAEADLVLSRAQRLLER